MLESGLARVFARHIVVCGAIQLLMLSIALAQNLSSAPMIFDVRRSLPLDAEEPVFHDFYIDAGSEVGFRKGMFITVIRAIPVHDPFQNKQQGTLKVPVAKLQVIHVDKNITVARLHSEFTDEERPTLDFESVMIGDRIDTDSMTMDKPTGGKSKSRKAAVEKSETIVVPVKVEVPKPDPGAAESTRQEPTRAPTLISVAPKTDTAAVLSKPPGQSAPLKQNLFPGHNGC